MVSLGVKPGAAGWKAQTNPLNYGSTQYSETFVSMQKLSWNVKHTDNGIARVNEPLIDRKLNWGYRIGRQEFCHLQTPDMNRSYT